jgi:hypothetical protein
MPSSGWVSDCWVGLSTVSSLKTAETQNFFPFLSTAAKKLVLSQKSPTFAQSKTANGKNRGCLGASLQVQVIHKKKIWI